MTLQNGLVLYHSPAPWPIFYIGWVGSGWQRHCTTCRSLHELNHQGTFFFFLLLFLGGRSQASVELDQFVRGGERFLRTRGMIVSRSVYGKAPTRQLHSTLIALPGNGHTGSYVKPLKLPSTCKSASQAVHTRMQCTLHATHRTPHCASRLVQAMSAWSVKTRHAPSRHSRNARVK